MRYSKYLTVTLLSLSLIALELVWTRIFSAEYFYTFAFLILSTAILGLGLGGLSLRIFKFLNNTGLFPWFLILSALCALAGPVIVINLKLDFSQLFGSGLMVFKFILTVIILSSSFFFGGTALSFIFKENYGSIGKLYYADLLGAGAGVPVIIFAMNLFGTPAAAFLCALPVLTAAIIESKKYFKAVPLLLMIAGIIMSLNAEKLMSPEKKERAPVVYTHWDATSKIKIFEYSKDDRGINIDNAANSPVYGFDGNWNRPDSLKFQFAIDVSNLISRFDKCRFLSLGAGGGTDVLQALQAGANEITAVEINPHINYMMTEGFLHDFSGRIYSDPRVKVVTEDGRAFIRRHKKKFDIIYSLSSNSFAALASGSFALSENYLFTREAFEDYWNALSDSGFIMMEHQFYVPRLVPELMNALFDLNVPNLETHFAVYNLPKMHRNILFISKQPLTPELLENAFGKTSPADHDYKYLLYPSPDSLKNNLINKIVQFGWEKASAYSAVDISPCNDNRPYVAQLGLWKNFGFKELNQAKPYEFFGFPISKIIIGIILLLVILIILPLNLLPYLRKGTKLKAAPWLYFFSIGAAFMMIEVILIQKYSLLIGPTLYGVSAVLFTLLISSGIGSRFSSRFSDRSAFAGILIWIICDSLFFKTAVGFFGGLELLPRILIAALIISPLGFFMGMPFPKATLKVKELIDWGFAVNGAASVLGSTVVIIIAISFGFNTAMFTAAIIYLFSYFLISRSEAW